jgi:hypothetical protein
LNYSDYDHLIEVEKDDRRKRPYEAASDLLHESMHYIYGLYDEYGDAGINPHDDEVYISIDSLMALFPVQVRVFPFLL